MKDTKNYIIAIERILNEYQENFINKLRDQMPRPLTDVEVSIAKAAFIKGAECMNFIKDTVK